MDIALLNALRTEIKERNPIEQVIGEVLPLKGNLTICPFHQDTNPSLSINVREQYFNCFGCGVGGDVVRFVMRYYNLSLHSALEFLAKRAGMDIHLDPKDWAEEKKQRDIEGALAEATIAYQNNIPPDVRKYLNDRGISNETIEKFHVGFCKGSEQLKGDSEALVKAGILYDNGGHFFKGHITFPHFYNGSVIYISGRGWPEKRHLKLDGDKVTLTHLYHEEALRQKDVIISEGEIDTLTLLQHGFNASGILGAGAFQPEWVGKFKHHEVVYVTLDGDKAGKEGNIRTAQLLGAKARIVSMPEGKDVNEFFRENSKEDYQNLLGKAVTHLEHQIKEIPADTDKTKLPSRLYPILQEMAALNVAECEAILNYSIKERFSLNDADVRSYRKDISKLRKETQKPAGEQSQTTESQLAKLKTCKELLQLNLPQDYLNGKMYFGIEIDNQSHIVNSDKELFPASVAETRGLEVKHDETDTFKFSKKGIVSFIEQNRTINIYELYNRILDYLKQYIVFNNENNPKLIAVWIIGTYLYQIFRYYPYIWLQAEKASGKTLLMEVSSPLSFNGELYVNPTEAVIFRDVAYNSKTMFLDEVEKFRKQDEKLHGQIMTILKAGFNKSGQASRVEPDSNGQFTIKRYSAFSPKMFAGINDLDDVLADRTIRVALIRKNDSEIILRYKEGPEILEKQRQIRDDLYIYALMNASIVAKKYNTENIVKNQSLNGRELDIWEPIFLLANLIDEVSGNDELTESMMELSEECIKLKQQDNCFQNDTCKLLTVALTLFEGTPYLSEKDGVYIFETQNVYDHFRFTDEFSWLDSQNYLTRLLKKIEVLSDQQRVNGERKRVYVFDRKKIHDYCVRYKIPIPEAVKTS